MSAQPKPKIQEVKKPATPVVESDLAGVVNAPTIINAFGKQYEIRQLSIGQAFQASVHIAKMTVVFQVWGEVQKLDASLNEKLSEVIQTVPFSEDAILGLLSVATGESPEWLKQQNSMEATYVLGAVVEKNLPLFSPENIKRFKGQFGGLLAQISQLGGATSENSSATGTAP